MLLLLLEKCRSTQEETEGGDKRKHDEVEEAEDEEDEVHLSSPAVYL